MKKEAKEKKKRPQRSRAEKIYHFVVKWPKRIGISIFFLVFFIFMVLQLPAVQNYIKNKTIDKLEKELNTEISISGFKFSLINGFYLKDLYIEDLHQDTLLYAHKVQVSLSRGAYSLIQNELDINEIELDQANIYLFRDKDSTDFNAQFLLDYFKSDKPKKDRAKINLALQKIRLDKIRFHKRDDRKMSNFDAYIHQGDITMDSINLNNNQFDIRRVVLTNPGFSTFKHKNLVKPTDDTGHQPNAPNA
ncbi:MAG TPA: hypothetical protein ENK85_08255, partial [Saprospiraceae bacterium]|nr:hypothetical protein [Saprospiraceae bacterium]